MARLLNSDLTCILILKQNKICNSTVFKLAIFRKSHLVFGDHLSYPQPLLPSCTSPLLMHSLQDYQGFSYKYICYQNTLNNLFNFLGCFANSAIFFSWLILWWNINYKKKVIFSLKEVIKSNHVNDIFCELGHKVNIPKRFSDFLDCSLLWGSVIWG